MVKACFMKVESYPSGRPSYLSSLDIARGLAALAVVLWHWQHFFFKGPLPGPFEHQELPLYNVLFLFYERGWMAVDFFFVLSGFIFFRLYSRAISAGDIGPWEFFVLRFSRLYPLHLLTLFLVAGLQWLMLQWQGRPFVYQLNDGYHFLLNLFFASAWGLQEGFSFNAPVWSVSIEVLLYGLFFVAMRLLKVRLWSVLLLAAAGFLLQGHSELIGRGLFAFYVGGVVFFAFRYLSFLERAARWAWGLTGLCLIAWGLTVVEFKTGVFARQLGGLWPGVGTVNWVALWVVGVLLPLSLLCIAMLEQGREGRELPGKWLGEISYSSYLLHFPLQLTFFAVAVACGFDSHVFYSPYVWLTYFCLLIGFSVVVHRTFELPVQRLIRQRFYARHSPVVSN